MDSRVQFLREPAGRQDQGLAFTLDYPEKGRFTLKLHLRSVRTLSGWEDGVDFGVGPGVEGKSVRPRRGWWPPSGGKGYRFDSCRG
jgi:hypothetical protein